MPSDALIQNIGFLQLQIVTGEAGTNLRRLRQALSQLNPPKQSLLVLPELWATGFAYGELPALQNEIPKIYDELQELAARYDILLAGTLPEQVDGEKNMFYNTLGIVGGSGTYGPYRKHHLFPGEEAAFCEWLASSRPISTPAGTFGCMICFDLRFPDIARSQCQQGADMLICPAQWPIARIHHWRSLVIARAIENQTYIVACNGVGKNGEQTLGGHSLIVSPAGEILHEAGENEAAEVIAIDWQVKKDAQAHFRSFTANRYRLSAPTKLFAPETCVEYVEQRSMIGQQVVYVVLEHDLSFSRAIELLEEARQHADFLVVGLILPKQDDTLSSRNRQLLQSYAALGCVDAIFDFHELRPSSEQRLKNICLTVSH